MGKKDSAGDDASRVKKEKKEKKRSESDGVHKSSKKDKKEKKSKAGLERALDEHLQASAAASVAEAAAAPASDDEMEDSSKAVAVKEVVPKGNMVVFAKPLADDKVHKKVYKTVKKATKKHALLRGVKEVNKALRKSPAKTAGTTEVPGVVIIAGDISPAEVIMHLPVYCEERNVPYLFVNSRAELGAAAKTKRPTSVVMLLPNGRKKAAAPKSKDGKKPAAVEEEDGDDADDYPKAWQELVGTAQKEFAKQLKGML